MAITNIHLAKNLDLSPLQHDQIRLGLRIKYPSGAGGFITGECRKLTEDAAEFVSTNPHWPYNLVVKFNQPDLTDEEFVLLLEIIKRIRSPLAIASQEDMKHIARATELGYLSSISVSQRTLTEKAFVRIELLQCS